MVTSISINSHLPHVPLTGCRFLPFNFIAARQLRRASSLMRFCTVVRSHGSCNFLWYLRDQIYTSSNQLILYWFSELTIGLRRSFPHPWHFDYRLNSSLLHFGNLVFSSAYQLSWVFLVRRVLTRFTESCFWSGILGKFLCLGLLKFLCLPRDWSVFRYIFDSFLFWFTRDFIYLNFLLSDQVYLVFRFATTSVSPFLAII